MRHLLAGCSSCALRLKATEETWTRYVTEAPDELVEPEAEVVSASPVAYRYEEVFARAERALDLIVGAGNTSKHHLDSRLSELALLAVTGPKSQSPLDRESLPLPYMIKWLVERSYAMRFDDPEQMLYWSYLARVAADSCSAAEARSEQRLADLRALAYGQFGNALKVCGRLPDAEESLTTAQRHRADGTGDPLLRGRLEEQAASLEVFGRRFEDSLASIAEASRIYRELDAMHELARTMVLRAVVVLYAGEPEKAVRLLKKAIPLIDSEEDLHLLLAARNNLALSYLELGKPERALPIHLEVQGLREFVSGSLIQLRVAWQGGILLRELGDAQLAERSLLRVREGFDARGLAYEAAVVSLDLEVVYEDLGRPEDMRKSVETTAPIFRALRMDRERLASRLRHRAVA